MDTELLESRFARLRARVKVRDVALGWRADAFAVDIGADEKGEFFDIQVSPGETLEVDAVDVRPDLRHLLLLVRRGGRKDKFLCGHDERHWFVAAVPGAAVSTVKTAMEALKPAAVRQAESAKRVPDRDRRRRRNEAFVRQGEWFFVPVPDLLVDERLITRNEPLSRGRGSTPHTCVEAYRRGGVTVYVNRRHPAGLLVKDYKALLEREPGAVNWGWRVMTRDAEVYARGRVRHLDHRTVHLRGWHRVLMNTENEAPAMRHVAFLD